MTLIIKQYGISLKRIEKEDVELIRKWRNDYNIRKWMGYQKIISKKQQIKWFESINNKYNYYFLILVDNKPIGVINCKNVNIKEEYGEGGIFIAVKDFLNTPYPLIASVILLDFIFNYLKIGNKSFVRILSHNKKAILYNNKLGYTLLPGQEKINNQWYVLIREDFNSKADKIKKAIKLYTESDEVINVEGEITENNLDKINNYLAKF